MWLLLFSDRGLCCAVPDAAPGDVGGGGGSRCELVITWEVSHLSYVLVCSPKWQRPAGWTYFHIAEQATYYFALNQGTFSIWLVGVINCWAKLKCSSVAEVVIS